jgi:hypothetical protein
MKKIKITKEQYNRVTKLLNEGLPELNPKNPSKIDKNFYNATKGGNIKNISVSEEKKSYTDFNVKQPIKGLSTSVQGKFGKPNSITENIDNLKQETLELIKYLYRKTEEFSPFWAEHDLTYDDICDALESKGIIIKKDGKFELSKSLGSPEEAKQAVEDELSKMIGNNEITEYDNYNYPMGADADSNATWNQKNKNYSKATLDVNKLSFEGECLNRIDTIAILRNKKNNELYVLNYYQATEDELNEIASELGYLEIKYGKHEDDTEYIYDWADDELAELTVLSGYASKIENEAKEGLEAFNDNVELVKIDVELKDFLFELYSLNKKFISCFKSLLPNNDSGQDVNEMEDSEIKQRLGEPFRQQPSGYEEKSPEEKERIRQSLAAIRAKSQAQDIERFKQRDLQNAIATANAEKKLKNVEPEIPELPLKPKGQYNIFGGVDEMALGGAGAMGGVAAPNTAANSGQYTTAVDLGGEGIVKRKMPNVKVVRESMEASPNTTGEYTAPAFKMKKNHTDFAETNPKAFQKTQWSGGGFVEFDDCTKLNNNTKAQKGGCSTGAVDKVVKIKKTKGNVNAPSLSESKIYETIAKKTGKTIDEVKRIIESKKNKS